MALRSELLKDDGELARLISDYGYAVSDTDGVGRYLSSNAAVIPVLQEAARELPRYFPPGAHRALRVFRDQEWGDVGPLFVTIEWPHDAGLEALDRLNRFEDEWWIPRAITSKTGDRVVFETA